MSAPGTAATETPGMNADELAAAKSFDAKKKGPKLKKKEKAKRKKGHLLGVMLADLQMPPPQIQQPLLP